MVEQQHTVQKWRRYSRWRTGLLVVVWSGGTTGLPAHGFARNLPWTLKSHHEDADGVALTFELTQSEETKILPHDFTLLAHFRVGKTCEIDLESHGEFETTSALHTYFNVGDIAKVSVSGLGDRFIDKVNDAKENVLTDGIQTFLTVPIACI